jgi:uncharacterized protein
MEIIMHRYKEMDLKDSTVINGFPSTSLINSIVASYLVNVLNLDQICGLDSDEFPPVSMIYDSKPKFPARIYADEKAKIVVFLSNLHLTRQWQGMLPTLFCHLQKKQDVQG